MLVRLSRREAATPDEREASHDSIGPVISRQAAEIVRTSEADVAAHEREEFEVLRHLVAVEVGPELALPPARARRESQVGVERNANDSELERIELEFSTYARPVGEKGVLDLQTRDANAV
jgi:hypothetical protein